MAVVAPLTEDEVARLEALIAYDVLDTPHEAVFQAIASLAASITGSPIALISLVDKDRQWFKANWGLDARETPRDIAFCSHAIHQDELFEVRDTHLDVRFFDNPLVQGNPNIRFYAGHPLQTEAGFKLGTLCVIDRHPRALSDEQRNSLKELAVVVMRLFEAHRKSREIEAELLKLARCDSLTSLANRVSLYESLNLALARLRRSGGIVAVLFLDLDQFKVINDRFGHAGGDAVLREFAVRLKSSIRQTDFVARIAGDEFVVVLEALYAPTEADEIANKILRNLENSIVIGAQKFEISTSIGIAFASIEDDVESVLKRADEALYRAKLAGRNIFKH